MSLHSLFLVMVCAAEAARLDVSRVLLPHRHDVVTNYTLGVVDEDESGCYEWMSSRPEVATVFTEGPCSRQANVSAVWDQASRQETTVVAREQRETIFTYLFGKVASVLADNVHPSHGHSF
ncbi:hypothetical protein MRX96_018368 [Rhipicephalus microplus]